MSESHESSYYEIALSNRQVLIMFVVLLSCMIVAFVSGVWVGKKDPVDLQPQVAEMQTDSQLQESEKLGELKFFSAEPPLAQVANSPSPDKTLREEVASQVQAKSSPAVPIPEKELEEAPKSTEPKPVVPEQAAVPEADGPWVIQVFSSKDQIQADRLVERLVQGGFPAFAISENVAGNTLYRVRIGPYSDRRRAEQVANLVKKSFRVDTWITH